MSHCGRSLPRRRFLSAVGAAASVPLFLPERASSQEPPQTVHIVVPFAAGGPVETHARVVADALRATGRNYVVDNKPGAGGNHERGG